MTRGIVSSRLVDQLVTIGLSTVGASGSSTWAGSGSSSVVAMMTCSNCFPPSPSVVLTLIPAYATEEPESLIGSSPPCPTGDATPVGAGSEGDAGGVDVQVAGDAGLGLGGDQVVADRLGFPRHREVEIVGAAGLAVAALVAGAGFALLAGATAGLGAARRRALAAGGAVTGRGFALPVLGGGGSGGGGGRPVLRGVLGAAGGGGGEGCHGCGGQDEPGGRGGETRAHHILQRVVGSGASC